MRRNSLQNLQFLVHGSVSLCLNSILVKWRHIEMVVFYMLSICLCKNCPKTITLSVSLDIAATISSGNLSVVVLSGKAFV